MKQAWLEEHRSWNRRDMSLSRYCYIWVGTTSTCGFHEGRLRVPTLMGATEDGRKELVAVVAGGYRESAESWLEVLRDPKERGRMPSPKLCIGDGALGFWKAIRQVYPAADHQRCWVHKTANVLDKLPKSVQTSAKAPIHDIHRAETEEDARSACSVPGAASAKYPRAVDNLMKDEASLFTFYRYLAEHWQHIRSTNTIESAFAMVRLRTAKTWGQSTMATTLAMVFKLAERAQLKWRRPQGHHLVEKRSSTRGQPCQRNRETLAA